MSLFSKIREFFTPKTVFISQSELSDPSVNFPPIWFGGPHYEILRVLYENEPYEMTRKQINYHLGKSKYHAYERSLWLGGYVHRREINNPRGGKIHFYTLTPAGKNALIKFNDKYNEKKKSHP